MPTSYCARAVISFLVLVTSSAGVAQIDPVMQPVLLPVYTGSLPGAYGSVWRTEFAVMNTSTTVARYTLPPSESFPGGGLSGIGPGHAFRLDTGAVIPHGVLFWIDEEHENAVELNLRARDLSRQAESAGTAIPTVRRDAFQSRITLLDVPIDERFRHLLRVYSLGLDTVTVVIRVFAFSPIRVDPPPVEPIAALTVELVSSERALPGGLPLIPAQAALHNILPMASSDVSAVRVEIESADGRPIWAFVATSNNVTQELTVTAPQ